MPAGHGPLGSLTRKVHRPRLDDSVSSWLKSVNGDWPHFGVGNTYLVITLFQLKGRAVESTTFGVVNCDRNGPQLTKTYEPKPDNFIRDYHGWKKTPKRSAGFFVCVC